MNIKVNDLIYLRIIQILFSSITAFIILMTVNVNKNIDNQIVVEDEGITNIELESVGNSEAAEIINNNEDNDNDNNNNSVVVLASIDINSNIVVPVHGLITSRFGGRTNPITGIYSNHTGLDIAAKQGTDILAAYNGVVEETGTTQKAGKYVLLLHSDGSETLYCHCSEICVSEEYLVKAGELIAKVGSTGWSTGPHLHFEVRIDGESVDPLEYLIEKDGCV